MDDLYLYKRKDRTPGVYSPSPREQWRQDHTRFHFLRYLTFELFAISASISGNERTFSIASGSASNKKPRAMYEFGNAQQFLRSCYDRGIA
jgi:hypothetical protein